MKTLKCPLCGSLLKLDFSCKYICPNCELAAKSGITKEEALKRAEKLISQFPPIMRVSPGDKLKFFNHQMRQKIASIEKVNLKDGWIKTNKGFARPDDVILWPWELKQEGGDNGR